MGKSQKAKSKNQNLLAKKRLREKIASRNYRCKIKEDPEQYEQYKAKDRERKQRAKELGKLPTVKELSTRGKRAKRKKMREYMREYRLKQKEKLNQQTVLQVTDLDHQKPNKSFIDTSPKHLSRQKLCGRKQIRRDRAKVYQRNKELEKKIEELQRKVWVLKKREARKQKVKKTPNMTPKSKLCRISEAKFIPKRVRFELFKGLVIQEECKVAKQEIGGNIKKKTVYSRLFSGKIIKKYKLLRQCKDILPNHSSKLARKWRKTNMGCDTLKVDLMTSGSIIKKRETVVKFLLSDTASHCTAGKKDYVVIKGEKVQKRYLNDTMSALYRKFLRDSPCAVSFAFFCKHRPAFVKTPKLTGRDTCLCVKCDNFKLLLSSLKASKIVEEKNTQDIVNSLCCDSENLDCMSRTCNNCKSKQILFNEINVREAISFQKWTTEKIQHRGDNDKLVKITTKNLVKTTVAEAKDLFEQMLPNYLAHVGRINHQREAWQLLNMQISESDLLLTVDWSENYQCKFHSEVQSVHFGGSHQQISLHTGMAVKRNTSESFCTLSENTQHGPYAIYAHLKPVLLRYAEKETKTVHFLSDGPTTQYRCSKMFNIVASKISKLLPKVRCIIWNFSESGHGKSIADGVGGTVKRTADSAVSHGLDITDVNSFAKVVSERCAKIFVHVVSDSEIKAAEALPLPDVIPFKGTLKVHQYCWLKKAPKEITFKELSCYKCSFGEKVCPHYSMGKPWIITDQKLKATTKSVSIKKKKVAVEMQAPVMGLRRSKRNK